MYRTDVTSEFKIFFRNAEEKIQHGQYDTNRRLGERINDITFWRNEVAAELERMLHEIERLHDCRSILEKAARDIEGPLHIAEECLYHREARKGLHDITKSFLTYTSSFGYCKDIINNPMFFFRYRIGT